MTYDFLAHFIKIGGTVAFTSVFVIAIIYALWPSNREQFDRAAHLPLETNDAPEIDQ